VWDPTVYNKNRDRLLAGDVATAFFQAVRAEAEPRDLISDEHFTVDGTLLEACASLKSVMKVGDTETPPEDPGNPTVNFHGETVAQNDTNRRSAIDKRTTRHPGYAISQQKRKRVEEIFG
jgi:hypothetical protein